MEVVLFHRPGRRFWDTMQWLQLGRMQDFRIIKLPLQHIITRTHTTTTRMRIHIILIPWIYMYPKDFPTTGECLDFSYAIGSILHKENLLMHRISMFQIIKKKYVVPSRIFFAKVESNSVM